MGAGLVWWLCCSNCYRSPGALVGHVSRVPRRQLAPPRLVLPGGVSPLHPPRLPLRHSRLAPAEDGPVALGTFTLLPSKYLRDWRARRGEARNEAQPSESSLAVSGRPRGPGVEPLAAAHEVGS